MIVMERDAVRLCGDEDERRARSGAMVVFCVFFVLILAVEG